MLEVATSAGVFETDRMSQQRHAAEVDRVVENSTVFKVKQLMQGTAITAYPSTPASIVPEINELRESRQQIRTGHDQRLVAIREAVDRGGVGLNGFEAFAKTLNIDKPALVRSVADWLMVAIDTSKRHVAALRPIPGQLEIEAEKVVEQVKSDLTSIGSGVETMTGHSHENPDAAARQFDYLARQNSKSRAAIEKAQQAKAEFDAAVETMNRLPERLEQAKKMLRALAVEAVTSAT